MNSQAADGAVAPREVSDSSNKSAGIGRGQSWYQAAESAAWFIQQGGMP